MIKIFPQKYNKKDFKLFLKKNNVDDNTIRKFVQLPESVKHSGNTYNLDISATWYNIGNTYYTFELNYYSEELIEYLFSLKVFKDIKISINNLLCELINANYIKKKNK
jgi:hypothetical protein